MAHQSLARFELVLDLLAKAIGVGGELKVILGVTLLCWGKKGEQKEIKMERHRQ